ncbi:hypothetical protein BCON_0068g00410 [Botryotinia convoluta]|uniref:Uncharacterized protein n=1 Tax=Botryotinia convoluta TaxID=54673 RepID=A0A4Z1IDW7_9HELO|nr:hypothetical protein BCON_0068g00410 [Botryotinia convoluta]
MPVNPSTLKWWFGSAAASMRACLSVRRPNAGNTCRRRTPQSHSCRSPSSFCYACLVATFVSVGQLDIGIPESAEAKYFVMWHGCLAAPPSDGDFERRLSPYMGVLDPDHNGILDVSIVIKWPSFKYVVLVEQWP